MFVRTMRLFAIVLIVLLTAGAGSARADGSATGGFHVPTEGGRLSIEFHARATDNEGAGTGQMTFTAPVELPDVDEDNEIGQKGSFNNLSMRVEFDCVLIRTNQASMSGLVREASLTGYVGKRVLLTVEDGGEGANAPPDGFTWGIYVANPLTWVPADAELEFDNGWNSTWIASDAEREDDRGEPFVRELEIDCRSFSFSAYTLLEVPRGGGNLQVRP